VFLAHDGLPIVAGYLLAFGMTPIFAFAYWLKNPSLGFLKSWAYAHCYALYAYMWIPAGWIAVYRTVAGRRGWAKTARTVDATTTIPVIDLRMPTTTEVREPVPVIDLRDSVLRPDSAGVALTLP
jgi:hypothetical protein